MITTFLLFQMFKEFPENIPNSLKLENLKKMIITKEPLENYKIDLHYLIIFK